MDDLKADDRGRHDLVVDDLLIRLSTHQVFKDGIEVHLPRLSYRLLLELLQSAPSVVSIEQLIDRVWEGRVVNPETVTQRVKLLREALGDDAKNPRYIGLVRGDGYRLLPSVHSSPHADTPATTILPLRDFEPGPQRSSHADHRRKRKNALATVLLALAGIAAAVALFRPLNPDAGPGASLTADQDPSSVETMPAESIAVLPFANLSATNEHDYLVNGLVAELIQTLADVPSLRVASNTASSYFKDPQVKIATIGHELNVQYVVEGSIRASEQKLRVSVQLTDVTDGFQVWSNTYDRELSDLLHLQVDLSRAIVAELPLLLDDAQFAAAIRAGTTNPSAYDAVLRGQAIEAKIQFPEDLEQAIELYKTAIELDAHFYEAYSLLASALLVRAYYPGGGFTKEAVAEAIQLLETIEELDVDRKRPGRASHLEKLYRLRGDLANQEKIVRHQLIKRAPEANHYYIYGHILRDAALPQPALAYLEYAEKMEPLNPSFKRATGIVWYNIGEFRKAITKMDECLSLQPIDGWCNSYKGSALANLGELDQGLALLGAGVWDSRSSRCVAMLEGGRHCDPAENYDSVLTANVKMAVLVGDYDTAFQWIDHAIDSVHPLSGQFRAQAHAWPQKFHADPRWQQALERMGHTDVWRDELCQRAQLLEPYTEIRVECPRSRP